MIGRNVRNSKIQHTYWSAFLAILHVCFVVRERSLPQGTMPTHSFTYRRSDDDQFLDYQHS